MNSYDLNGRTAIITGGGSGLGLATARRFVLSGASVQLWGRDAARLESAAADLGAARGGAVSLQSVDVADPAAVERGIDAFTLSHGRLDILFNCAGTVQPAVPTSALSIDEWRRNIVVNLDSIFFTCRLAAPIMVRAGYGRIINTSSMAGKDGNALQIAYASAKAGVIAFTKSLGKELATTGVIVNFIAPTLFETPLVRASMIGAEDVFEQLKAKIPLGRFGDPAEAAAMVCWLASEECSFSTGFAFDLSGGRATY